MDDRDQFEKDKLRWAADMAGDAELQAVATDMLVKADQHHYPYQWSWLGVPIIQLSNDIMVQQEIVWRTRPQLIIETGVARGGSMIFLASLLELIGEGEVLGIDIDIRDHNRDSIESHPLSKRVSLIEGPSVGDDVLAQVRAKAEGVERVMVILDSDHTHEHVLQELEVYAPLVSPEQYLVVADTVIEKHPVNDDRPRRWGPGNSPLSALDAYLKTTDRFALDQDIDNKLLYTASPHGYLKCTG